MHRNQRDTTRSAWCPRSRFAASTIHAIPLAIPLALAFALPAGASNRSDLFAGEITNETPASRIIQGSDAIAGLGDWYLGNGVVCAAVLGTSSEGQLIETGGTLVDLGYCGRDDDQFIGLEPLFNLSRNEILAVSQMRAETDTREARIVAEARDQGIHYVTHFVLDRLDPERILIRSTLTREEDGPRFFAIAEILQNTKSALRNFIINSSGPGEGFEHISLEDSAYLAIGRAIRRADGIVIIGSEVQVPPISYSYRVMRALQIDADAAAHELGHYSLAMESVSVTAVMADPLWFDSDSIGLLQAAQGMLMDLEKGESLIFEREIRVSKRADVASHSDRIFSGPDRGPTTRVRGHVDDPGTRLHVDRIDDDEPSPFTMARPAPDGSFGFVLPAGRYALRAVAAGDRTRVVPFEIPEPSEATPRSPARVDLGEIHMGAMARIELPSGSPMRLVFRGIGDTPDPVFGSDLTGLTINGVAKPASLETHDLHLAGRPDDPRYLAIAPGRYRVLATRGLEFSLSEGEIEARAGETVKLAIEPPRREFETPGWISADFHVHASASFDSTLPQRTRVRSFVAEGCEILVSTEHDVISRYDELISEMGLDGALRSLSGVEVTTVSKGPVTPHTTGHINVYPLPYRPRNNRNGAIRGEGKRLREIIDSARQIPGERLVQLNHPRNPDSDDSDGSFFEHLAVAGVPYDPELPLQAEPNRVLLERDPRSGLRDIDFDAMEIFNGKRVEAYREVRADWLALLDQGYRPTGMANSDSHRLGTVVGVPRNYVRMQDDRIGAFAQDEFVAAAKQGRVFGTTGPMLEVSFEGAGPGQTVMTGKGRLSINVRSASWIPVDRLRIYLPDGVIVRLPIVMKAPGVAEPLSHEFDFSNDAYIVVEVEGEAKAPYSDVLAGFTPLAFSNPIYIDADADGKWLPKGSKTTP